MFGKNKKLNTIHPFHTYLHMQPGAAVLEFENCAVLPPFPTDTRMDRSGSNWAALARDRTDQVGPLRSVLASLGKEEEQHGFQTPETLMGTDEPALVKGH